MNSLVCSPNQCLQGSSETTIGETLLSGISLVRLLPGEYTTRTANPQLVHILKSTNAGNLSQSPGFNLSSFNPLPLNVSLLAGLAFYSNSLYSGQATFSPLPSTQMNNSIPLPASSLALSDNVWMALTSGSNNNSIIFWKAVPDVSQLPSAASQSLALVDIQSYACSPACSGSAVCSTSGKCNCPSPGFTGSACEVCAKGFFGPTCQPCPSQCKTCDEGISGSGECLLPLISNTPATCNCVNGLCGTDGTCACNSGWVNDANGTACAQCASNFYLTSTGDCKRCQMACSRCADRSATCLVCQKDFTRDPNDKTKCIPKLPEFGVTCRDGSYSAGKSCENCSPSCRTCNGPSSNNCILCPIGVTGVTGLNYKFNGSCVPADSNGICEGSNGMIADVNKQECDACGAKCTSCKIPNFQSGATISKLQCTACLPGSFLTQGHCAERCPSGTFVSPLDNSTCTACSSPCASCSSASYCLTCKYPQLASSGQCVSTCINGTFPSSGACVKCHPDCSDCSGPSFNQCTACFPTSPVLLNGRCVKTCAAQSQFFDWNNSTCRTCHSSCSSCAGPGSTDCLSCSDPTQVLRAGSCISANCTGSSNVVPGLGVCLSELVQVINSTTTTRTTSTVSSSSTPISVPTSTSTEDSSTPSSESTPESTPESTSESTSVVVVNRLRIAWWEILLMVFGGIFILVVVAMIWRRCMRKQRVKETTNFVGEKEAQLRRRWMDTLNKGEFYPEGVYRDMAGPEDLPEDHMSYRDSLRSHSVYSQDMNMAWQEHGRYSKL